MAHQNAVIRASIYYVEIFPSARVQGERNHKMKMRQFGMRLIF
jgi:hypothetical protein